MTEHCYGLPESHFQGRKGRRVRASAGDHLRLPLDCGALPRPRQNPWTIPLLP